MLRWAHQVQQCTILADKKRMSAENQSIGSLFVRPGKKENHKWRLMRTVYRSGIRGQESVPRIAYAALGFSDSMTLEQARARAQQLNATNSVKRIEQIKIEGIAKRVERDRLVHSAFVPADLNDGFLSWLEENTSGSPDYVEKQKIIWGTAKRGIISLQLLPEHFASNKKKIYRYFSLQTYSLSYVVKLISMLNQYGVYTARLIGKFYEMIPAPKGQDREMINDAYLTSEGFRGESMPLTPELLTMLGKDLPNDQYNWLFVTLWLGLRPGECDMILEDRGQKQWAVEPGEVDILKVYQTKLTAVPRHKRWKRIPLLYPEQQQALSILVEGCARAPLVKTLKKYAGTQQIGLYAGRKGFSDLMLENGQDLVHIARWMGHTSFERTYTRYMSKEEVHYTLPVPKRND